MKSKKRIFLLISLICIAAASLVAAGCSIGRQTYDEYRNERNLNSIVTYYGNGGNFSASRTSIDVHFPEDSYLVEIDTEGFGNVEFSRAEYVLDGWYYAVLDDGEPVYENGSETVVLIDENRPVDFANTKTQAGEHLYIGAKWVPDVKIELVLASADPIKMNVEVPVTDEETGEQKVDEETGEPLFETKEQTFNRGDVLKYVSFGKNTSTVLYDSVAPDSTDSQFLRFYTDIEMNAELSGAVQKPSDGSNTQVYVEYLDNSWTVVKTAANVASMFAGAGGSRNKYYIFSDIDCAGATANMNSGNFNCTIDGNGYTLSNVNFNATRVSGSQTTISMLGNIGANANIKNLTITGVNITVTQTSGAPRVFAVLSSLNDGATFENFKIENITERITYNAASSGSRIDNIQFINGEYQTDNWIYGGFANDSAFNCEGFTLTGSLALYMNNEQAV